MNNKEKENNKPMSEKKLLFSNNMKILIAVLIALFLGLGIGYFLFGQKGNTHENHQHGNETKTPAAAAEEQIWTCSMHPNVRQNEFGICPICEMDLIVLEANTSSDPLVLEMTEEAAKLANIQTTIIGEEKNSKGKTIHMTGKVQADERLASSLTAHVPGRIEKLYVTFTSEEVYQGQKLAEIYSPELIAAQRELIEAKKLESLNPNLIKAVRNKLKYWKIGEATIRSIEESGRIQETFTVYSDESGIVSKRRVALGDYIKEGEALFDLMKLNKVWVLFDAFEEDLPNISIGDRIEFNTNAIPNKTFKTNVTFIDPIVNPSTRTVSIRTEMSNTSKSLKPEMLVTGNFKKTKNKNKNKKQLTIPKSAVMWTGEKSVAYVKIPDMEIPSFQFREIEIGDGLGDQYQLISGIESGEEVVTYGSFTIDAAAQLNNQSSMMNKNVKLKTDGEELAIPNFIKSTPKEFKSQLNQLADAYFVLKDAFVATDAKAGSAAANKMKVKLEKINMELVKGDAHQYWMEQETALKSHNDKIIELKDVEEQREQFEFISIAMINSMQAFGTVGDTIYIQHCPMAFDNEGGDWLAKEERIQNPYFGDKMMRCGVVKKKINK